MATRTTLLEICVRGAGDGGMACAVVHRIDRCTKLGIAEGEPVLCL